MLAVFSIVGLPCIYFSDLGNLDFNASYERLKEIDPVAANRIHPNDHRKVRINLTCK